MTSAASLSPARKFCADPAREPVIAAVAEQGIITALAEELIIATARLHIIVPAIFPGRIVRWSSNATVSSPSPGSPDTWEAIGIGRLLDNRIPNCPLTKFSFTVKTPSTIKSVPDMVYVSRPSKLV